MSSYTRCHGAHMGLKEETACIFERGAMMEGFLEEPNYQEVRFDNFCKTCRYKDLPESESPCFECLEEPMRYYSDTPVKWMEK